MSVFKRLGHAVGWVAAVLMTVSMTWALTAERWSDRWGATDVEVAATLPGDALIEQPSLTSTRAVTVHAPASEVWPWIAQFGQGRGGLYSYDWLERVLGIDMESANAVLPDEQDVTVGDQVWITQPGYPANLGHVVADVERGRNLVLALSTPKQRFAPEDSPWTWAFVLRPAADGTTRLIVRNRNATLGGVGDAVWDRIVGPIGFAMERKTMLGIKERAEAAAGIDTDPPWREPVWFLALVMAGVAVLAIVATRTSFARKASYVVAITAAATVVLFRLTSAALAVALAAFACLTAVVLWRAWPPQRRRPQPVRAVADADAEKIPVGL